MSLVRAGILIGIAAILVGIGGLVGYYTGRKIARSQERDRCAAVSGDVETYLECVDQSKITGP